MMGPSGQDPLLTTEWLADHLSAPDVRIVDASWHMPDTGRNGRAEFEAAHIPGAVFFDLDAMSDPESPYPHMLPDAVQFSSRVRALGLGDGHRIVCYDGAGLFSAARAWWMFKVMGHEDVWVLDGGLPKWRAEDRPIEDLAPVGHGQARHFTARRQDMLTRDAETVAASLRSGREQVLDARSPDRFTGAEADPRPGVRSGHMPGSLNVHYRSLLREDGTLKDQDELRAVFDAAGIDWTRPAIASCGSGVTAAIIVLALTRLGHPAVSLFDGSWAEWGSRTDFPVATGSGDHGLSDRTAV